ncbi:radical SAM protein [Rhodoblastus sp. 17X3]|uniref:radical SAM protein n=1 Tax=Rhodoblastus sp. 17X3 TaxID=3047026 RepID=UPI0024B80023|nr:radical SAM protein [Rhodoblastus sp. 17X3]MDI9847434.1 radical SAM protein [Rhodoblastus sp. 17X3]
MNDIEPSPRHARSFLDAQRVASKRLGFSVTRACPLRCQHCSVNAAPEFAKTTFTTAFAHHVAEQMPDLAKIGVRFIDFTGGEPVLAHSFVRIVSEAAVNAGMTCGLVTAAHWAGDTAKAHALIDKFPNIENWDISADIYHLPFVPAENVRTAFLALESRGRSARIRVAHHDEMSFEEATLIDFVHRFAGRRIGFQPIGPVGRGKALVVSPQVDESERDRTACASTGLLIQNNGAGAPCCAPLSHESIRSPMFVGNAFTESLSDMVSRWRVHPLIQTIRLWGFAPLEAWLNEWGERSERFWRRQTCDECVAMLTDPVLVDRLNRRANRLDHRILLAIALQRDFREPWLEDQIKDEAQRRVEGDDRIWAEDDAPLEAFGLV